MIELLNINKSYDNNLILKDINLKISKNQKVIFKGDSGSGKSTLLGIIAGNIYPDSGAVFIDSNPISKLKGDRLINMKREYISVIFQGFNLIEDMSVYDNIILPLIPYSRDFDSANKLIKYYGLKKDIHTKHLSGGEKQRVAIARALITEPKIIIADEPTANLDKRLRDEFIELISNIDKTVIVATHDPLFHLDISYNLIDGELK
jgi:putative ABC transport system ATP-binding protein